MRLIQLLQEAVRVHDLQMWAYAAVVAETYDGKPQIEQQAVPAYKTLLARNEVMLKRLKSDVDVSYTPDDPYRSPEGVGQDIIQNKRLKVFRGGGNHPIMRDDDNNVFRTVHDYYAHVGPNRKTQGTYKTHNFTYRGELNAYLVHAKLAPKPAVPALFTEVIGQASYFLIMNQFPQQKAVILEGFDYYQLGRTSPQHQTRMKQIMQELQSGRVRLNIQGGINYPRTKINWSLLRTSTQQKVA
jgi:hypothetical protein